MGVCELGMGIAEGGAGIILNPLLGAKEQGVYGFFKGSLKCTVGVISKPVTGALDFVSQTAEGIKNTAIIFDDKALGEKVRLRRVFYGRQRYFKKYDKLDSLVYNKLRTKKDYLLRYMFEHEHFIAAYHFDGFENKLSQMRIVLLTKEHLFIFTGN